MQADTFEDVDDIQSIGELNRRCKFEFTASHSLRLWIRATKSWLKQGAVYEAEQDFARCYVCLMRATLLIVRHLPTHPEFNLSFYHADIQLLRTDVGRALDTLERLRPLLEARFSRRQESDVDDDSTLENNSSSDSELSVKEGVEFTASSSEESCVETDSTEDVDDEIPLAKSTKIDSQKEQKPIDLPPLPLHDSLTENILEDLVSLPTPDNLERSQTQPPQPQLSQKQGHQRNVSTDSLSKFEARFKELDSQAQEIQETTWAITTRSHNGMDGNLQSHANINKNAKDDVSKSHNDLKEPPQSMPSAQEDNEPLANIVSPRSQELQAYMASYAVMEHQFQTIDLRRISDASVKKPEPEKETKPTRPPLLPPKPPRPQVTHRSLDSLPNDSSEQAINTSALHQAGSQDRLRTNHAMVLNEFGSRSSSSEEMTNQKISNDNITSQINTESQKRPDDRIPQSFQPRRSSLPQNEQDVHRHSTTQYHRPLPQPQPHQRPPPHASSQSQQYHQQPTIAQYFSMQTQTMQPQPPRPYPVSYQTQQTFIPMQPQHAPQPQVVPYPHPFPQQQQYQQHVQFPTPVYPPRYSQPVFAPGVGPHNVTNYTQQSQSYAPPPSVSYQNAVTEFPRPFSNDQTTQQQGPPVSLNSEPTLRRLNSVIFQEKESPDKPHRHHHHHRRPSKSGGNPPPLPRRPSKQHPQPEANGQTTVLASSVLSPSETQTQKPSSNKEKKPGKLSSRLNLSKHSGSSSKKHKVSSSAYPGNVSLYQQPAVSAGIPTTPNSTPASRPTLTRQPSLRRKITLENGVALRPLWCPDIVISVFLKLAEKNTKRGIETCAVLAGKLSRDELFVTALIVPKQRGTPDTCTTENEEMLFEYQDANDLITLGWIHTHPTQTCFMSSVDLHTHLGYQLMLPEAIAIVCAPKYSNFGIFRLTNPPGVDVIMNCKDTRSFHPHPDLPIYLDVSRYGHVSLFKTPAENARQVLQVVDLR